MIKFVKLKITFSVNLSSEQSGFKVFVNGGASVLCSSPDLCVYFQGVNKDSYLILEKLPPE